MPIFPVPTRQVSRSLCQVVKESRLIDQAHLGRPRRRTIRDHNYFPRGAGQGNPAGRLRGSRNRLSEAVICALLRDFSKHGEKAIAKVRRTQPAAYLKICALLVPKEMKVEQSGGLKALSDEQLDQAIAALREIIEARAAEAAKVIEGTAEPVALPAPGPTDEQLDAALDALREITRGARRRGGENVIKGTAEPVALPAPEAQSPEATPEPTQKHKSNRLMREVDTAVGPRERKPSKR